MSSKVNCLRWLKNSIFGTAFDLIKVLETTVEANYDIAIKKLKDKYLCSTQIKQSKFDFIYNCKITSPENLVNTVHKN